MSATNSVAAEVRLYDRLFTVPQPGSDKEGPDWKTFLNPDSLKVLTTCRLEPSLAGASAGDCFQFERQGFITGFHYFSVVKHMYKVWNNIIKQPLIVRNHNTGIVRPF